MKIDDLFTVELPQLEEELDEQVPACWPNRPGNAEPYSIFVQVGHALTRWERVEVSVLETLQAMQPKLADTNKIVREYSRRREAQQKIALIISEFKKHANSQTNFLDFEGIYSAELKNYLKWKTARNRLAHGVVISAGSIMMEEIENGMVQTYQLHPSEVDQRAWMIPWQIITKTEGEFVREGNEDNHYINDGPTYSYMAKDIQQISDEFLNLDLRFRKLTKKFIGDKIGFDSLLEGITDDEGDLSK